MHNPAITEPAQKSEQSGYFQTRFSHSREEFSQKVSELATSNDVTNELSDELGMPKDHETEDEFVDRAKSILTKILKRKLSK